MNLIQLIYNNKLDEANEVLFDHLKTLAHKYLKEAKQYINSDLYEDNNIVRLGRTQRIRRRVRRDKNGRIIVQRNSNRSAVKGYRIVGRSIQRISAVQRFRRSQQLKRAWKTSRRAKLSRTLLKRKMSLRRRYSMGLR